MGRASGTLGLAGVLVACVGSVLPAAAVAQITMVPDTSRVVRATGRASIATPPDIATVTLGIWVADADAKRAKASVDLIIGKVVSLARALKVAEGDLRTTAVNIEPLYDPDNATRFRGYEVTRSVTVMLKDLNSLDALLDGAVQAGANRNFDVELASSRAAELKREATALALKDAVAQADAAAQQLGVRVAGIRSIDLESAGRQGTYNATVSSYVGGQAQARFLPGVIKISAEIPVVFLIEDRR